MNIVNETELMSNQKASTTVLPDVEFEALQTSAGNSLLFSISSENIFYCTYEVPGDTHGWQRVDLSSALSAKDFGGQSIKVKSFDLGQDLGAGTIDLVMVITDTNNHDWLYISLGNVDTTWLNYTPTWQQIKFDDQANIAFANDPINDIFIAGFGSNQFIFADIITSSSNQALSRYAIDPSGQVMYNTVGVNQCWIPHTTQMTLQAGQISSAVGCGPGDESVNGIYTLYNINGNPQLVYAPLFNEDDPGGPPFPTDFVLPAGASGTYKAMAISKPSTSSPDTDLFFATNGVLYFSPNASQINVNGVNPGFTQIYTHSLFNNIQSLNVNNWNGNIVLWGQSVNPDDPTTSQIFVMEGVSGQEKNSDAWSNPIPLLFNVKNSTTYVNNIYSQVSTLDTVNGNAYGSCSVIFAHQEDGSLVQLFQDPVTTAWQERYLLTEPLDATTALYETTSYTTHIRITDQYNMAQPLIPVLIWASSPCSVFVNNTYSTLNFTTPLQATTDGTGIVNIMQPVDTIGGISYNIAVQDSATQQWYTQSVNPLGVTSANIKTMVPDGSSNHLNVNVTDEMGNQTPLVNSSIDSGTQLSTSQNLYSISQHNSDPTINQDGLTTDQQSAGGWPKPGVSAVQAVQALKPAQRPKAKPDRLAKNMRFNAKTDKIWGCTFGKNAKHYEGIEAMKEMGLILHADGSMSLTMNNGVVLGSSNWLEAKAGHLFKWMKSEANKLEKLVVQIGTDGLDCLMTIAGDVYHFVVKCMNDIANAMHTLLNSIETAFEDLVKWIGSIFAWCDFIHTHNVIRNLFVQYGQHCIDSVDYAINGITGLVDNVMGVIDTWADIPGDSGQSQSQSNNQDVGQHKPQNNWAHHHIQNNANNSVFNLAANQYSSAVQTLMTAVSNEGEILSDTLAKLENIDITTISMADLVKQLVAIIADDVLLSMENILTTFLQVIGDIVQDMMETLTQETITIPVVSQIYERFVGSPLSLLDVVCLVAAIPVTVIYKLLNDGQAPFVANDPLATATDYASLCQLCSGQSAMQAVPAGMLGDISWNPPPLNDRWYRLFFAGNVMALFGGTFIGILGYMKTKDSSSKNLATLYALSYFLYIGPDIVGNIPGMIETDSRWFSVLNGSLAIVGVLKAFWDIKYVSAPADPAAPVPPGWFGNVTGLTGYSFLSPWLDALINGVWELPVVEAFTHSEKIANDIVDLVANTLFNASGVISPLVAFNIWPSGLAWAGVQTVANILYGGGSLAESVDGQPIDPITLK